MGGAAFALRRLTHCCMDVSGLRPSRSPLRRCACAIGCERALPLLLTGTLAHASGLRPSRSPLDVQRAPEPPATDACRTIKPSAHAFVILKHACIAAGPSLPVGMRARRIAYAGIESGFERAQPFAGVLGAGPQPLAAQATRAGGR